MERTSLHTISVEVLDLLRGLIESIFGPGLSHVVYGRLTQSDLLALAILAGFVWVLGLAVSSVARAYRRRAEKRDGDESWPGQILRMVTRPVRALVWLVGIYFVVTPALVKSQSAEDAPAALAFAERLLDIGIFAIIIWVFYRGTELIRIRLELRAKKSTNKFDDLLVPPLIQTVRVVLPLLAIILGLPVLELPAAYDDLVSKVTALTFVAVVAWIFFQSVRVGENLLLSTHDIKAENNLEARKVHTQVRVLSKTAYFIIILFTIASMLMVFEEVRRFGTNILASAGVVGIILGFAAQRTIANLFAGFQLAMAQPIRIDDVVIVEGEWGRIEEITLTYVVIRIWDQRRLIVPLSHFIEKPFQNWTRTSSEIMGSVFLWMDYTVPLDALREETKRLVESHPKWDRRFWNLQVTDTTDRAVQIRVLMTTANSGNGWDMRCDIREQLIRFLQKNYPGALPKVRAEMQAV
jgi:small-conductance mechanosensitive channel